jgi:hypothetical protein
MPDKKGDVYPFRNYEWSYSNYVNNNYSASATGSSERNGLFRNMGIFMRLVGGFISDPNPADNSIAGGEFATVCYMGQGYWDNIRIYDTDSTADYEITPQIVELPNYLFEQDLFAWTGFSAILELNTSDEIRFELSLDNGGSYLTHDGTNWTTNITGFADALTVSEINTHLPTLSTNTTQIRIRAYLKSNDGTTTPKIQQVKLLFKDRPL